MRKSAKWFFGLTLYSLTALTFALSVVAAMTGPVR